MMRADGIAPSTRFEDMITADHKILNVGIESRCGHRNALIVQDDFTNSIQSYPTKTNETSETMLCYKCFFSFLHRQIKRVFENLERPTMESLNKPFFHPCLEMLHIDILTNLVRSFTTQTMKHSRSH